MRQIFLLLIIIKKTSRTHCQFLILRTVCSRARQLSLPYLLWLFLYNFFTFITMFHYFSTATIDCSLYYLLCKLDYQSSCLTTCKTKDTTIKTKNATTTKQPPAMSSNVPIHISKMAVPFHTKATPSSTGLPAAPPDQGMTATACLFSSADNTKTEHITSLQFIHLWKQHCHHHHHHHPIPISAVITITTSHVKQQLSRLTSLLCVRGMCRFEHS